MEINILRQDNAVVVHASGRLDSSSATLFQEQLLKVIEAEPALVIDMAGFSYVSSAGLRTLLIAAKKCNATGRRLALCGLNPDVRTVFVISGFLSLFLIRPARDEAVAAVS